jgi:hypothetical protein
MANFEEMRPAQYLVSKQSLREEAMNPDRRQRLEALLGWSGRRRGSRRSRSSAFGMPSTDRKKIPACGRDDAITGVVRVRLGQDDAETATYSASQIAIGAATQSESPDRVGAEHLAWRDDTAELVKLTAQPPMLPPLAITPVLK